mmetsp:Transcript_21007/g.34266  ORF Transcript_21007/g.34266 Transcript_21007/m.34266 type:complete len:91 (+) Transcript_21007:223-495(+)
MLGVSNQCGSELCDSHNIRYDVLPILLCHSLFPQMSWSLDPQDQRICKAQSLHSSIIPHLTSGGKTLQRCTLVHSMSSRKVNANMSNLYH